MVQVPASRCSRGPASWVSLLPRVIGADRDTLYTYIHRTPRRTLYTLHPLEPLNPTPYILYTLHLHPTPSGPSGPFTPYTLHPTSYTLYPLHPTPYTLHPTPYTLHLRPHGPYTLHPTPYTLHPTPQPYTLYPTPYNAKTTHRISAGLNGWACVHEIRCCGSVAYRAHIVHPLALGLRARSFAGDLLGGDAAELSEVSFLLVGFMVEKSVELRASVTPASVSHAARRCKQACRDGAGMPSDAASHVEFSSHKHSLQLVS
eukprot:scaffold15457_cov66-Phaeocystis_antarctica.AAC.3